MSNINWLMVFADDVKLYLVLDRENLDQMSLIFQQDIDTLVNTSGWFLGAENKVMVVYALLSVSALLIVIFKFMVCLSPYIIKLVKNTLHLWSAIRTSELLWTGL